MEPAEPTKTTPDFCASIEHGIKRLPTGLAELVSKQWQDFLASGADLDSLSQDPRLAETLPRVWAASEFVARQCIAQPGLITDLVHSGDLFRSYGTDEFRRRSGAQEKIESAALGARLRRLRRREAVRLAWRDLAAWADLDEVMGTMSALADHCLDIATRHSYFELSQQHGTPMGERSGSPVPMVVLGLGKLGGEELNFSSDVDLIFAYPEDGETDGQRPLSNHEFFTKLCRRLIELIDQVTEEGLVFRIDMRLRPNGDSGPLVLSFDAMEHYYQTHGRDWERYALIKARTVAGDHSQGRVLLGSLHPFVYRKYIDFGSIEAIRDMKSLIDQELRRKGIENNIKIGHGGIREIEFITQSFQLIRGGREPQLQSRRLLPTLKYLADSGILDRTRADVLTDSYRWLRNLEHRLQMSSDQQTHSLPDQDFDRLRLSFSCGADNWDALLGQIRQVTRRVHELFEQTFVAPQGEQSDAGHATMDNLWRGSLDEETRAQVLTQGGYDDPKGAWSLVKHLRNGQLYRSYSTISRGRLDRLMPLLLGAAGLTAEPGKTLSRLTNLVESIGRRSVYLSLLVENPLALSQLVKLSAASSWIGQWIGRHPILLDELLSPITAHDQTDRPTPGRELTQQLAQVADDDLEAHMNVLREVHHGQFLRIAAADVAGLLDVEDVGEALSEVAEACLDQVVGLARRQLEKRYGLPRLANGDEAGFAVVAYGKLGSRELGYHSDLDIIFLYAGAGASAGGDRSLSNEAYFSRLGQRIVHMISTRTPAGILYELDMRLRPSGRAGPLVTSIAAFDSYQQGRAWTWEHQALVRARIVTGTGEVAERFESIRRAVLCVPRDEQALRREVAEMRDKMVANTDASNSDQFDLKQGRGGLVDIEFLVQYFVLRHAHRHPDLLEIRGNVASLNALAEKALISTEHRDRLIAAYQALLSANHQLKLNDQPALIPADDYRAERAAVNDIWQTTLAG